MDLWFPDRILGGNYCVYTLYPKQGHSLWDGSMGRVKKYDRPSYKVKLSTIEPLGRGWTSEP
jgi:hypothetical protein